LQVKYNENMKEKGGETADNGDDYDGEIVDQEYVGPESSDHDQCRPADKAAIEMLIETALGHRPPEE
jgi:hypothetical protein